MGGVGGGCNNGDIDKENFLILIIYFVSLFLLAPFPPSYFTTLNILWNIPDIRIDEPNPTNTPQRMVIDKNDD